MNNFLKANLTQTEVNHVSVRDYAFSHGLIHIPLSSVLIMHSGTTVFTISVKGSVHLNHKETYFLSYPYWYLAMPQPHLSLGLSPTEDIQHFPSKLDVLRLFRGTGTSVEFFKCYFVLL